MEGQRGPSCPLLPHLLDPSEPTRDCLPSKAPQMVGRQTCEQTGHGGSARDHGSPAGSPGQIGEWERGREGFPEEVTGEALR